MKTHRCVICGLALFKQAASAGEAQRSGRGDRMRFGSVCSGIEAASVAWHPLGWRAAWLAEIEPFPSAVLAHHYPDTPNLGDMTTIAKRVLLGEVAAPDVLTGGTPCQAFSVSGLRQSLADERGNLTLKFVELLDAIDHVRGMRDLESAIAIWENVPGVLSTKDNAFGCFLAGLAGEDEPLQPPGEKWANAGCVYGPKRAIAWRTLDAQYFGLAQRRRRVFVVASARNDFDPAQVLFEWDGVRRDTAPSRGQAQDAAGTLAGGSRGRGGYSHDDIPLTASGQIAATLDASFGRLQGCSGQDANHGHSHLIAYGGNNTSGSIEVAPALLAAPGSGYKNDFESETLIAFTQNSRSEVRYLGGDGQIVGALAADAGAQQQNYIAFNARQDPDHWREHTGPLDCLGNTQAIAYTTKLHNTKSNQAGKVYPEYSTALDRSSPPPALLTPTQVRRLTPWECERLQGFPVGYTAIPWRGKPADQCPDGPRYKALGNSWAVPCARWIGERVEKVLSASRRAAA